MPPPTHDPPLLPEPAPERFDVFDVQQLTRGTALESLVAADLVHVGPFSRSQVHRHNLAETVLYVLAGEARARVGEQMLDVRAGDRVVIGKGVFHGFETGAAELRFLSVQSPPIQDERTGRLDLEPEEPAIPGGQGAVTGP